MRLYVPKITSDVRVSGLAPEVGFEPTTNRLTADRSTTELLWIALGDAKHTLLTVHAGQAALVQKKGCSRSAPFKKFGCGGWI